LPEHIEHTIFIFLNRDPANPFCDRLFFFLTTLHQQKWFQILVILFVAAIFWKGTRRGKAWVLCILLAIGITDSFCTRLLKHPIDRIRPCHRMYPGGPMEVPDIHLVGNCPGPGSFPSNHAANTMALAVVCWQFTKSRKKWLWFIIPALIGYTRIYLGYHYPSDVLGGWIIGAFLAWLFMRLTRKWNMARDGSAPSETANS
jgi:membrane-associated phospholipid phosphatase